ncbi:hypothetical protein BDY21DRAFT_95496 [Lineolata rhizophorae]|uniref:Uncharacterized protein n=1 Tax=Lineolata rhizophorae TaxID=578093 RepID=A0A6A6NSV0_9PEZI|nr:hypothetical protein BDY21DRAFT_95496 [Lineolata rhizophorae]
MVSQLPAVPEQTTKPSIEEFKLRIHQLELQILERFIQSTSDSSIPVGKRFCSTCLVFNEKLEDAISKASTVNQGNAVSRNATSDIILRTVPEILAEEICSLCRLIAKCFVREKRREIYARLAPADPAWRHLSTDRIARLFYPADDSDGERSPIRDRFASNVQLSLGSLAVDGTLALWWPEDSTDSLATSLHCSRWRLTTIAPSSACRLTRCICRSRSATSGAT